MLRVWLQKELLGNDHLHRRNGFARFTAGQSDLAVGALATALQDAQTATEPKTCRHRRKGCARNTISRLLGSVGGPDTETRVVLAVLKCRHRRKGCVASITNRSNPAVGWGADIAPVAVVATTVVRVIVRPKHGIRSVW